MSFTVLWLQSGGCGGCSMSLLNAESPDLYTRLRSVGIDLLWHPSLSEASTGEFLAIIEAIVNGQQRLDALCLEGSVMRGPHGSGRFHMLAGSGKSMMHWLEQLADKARYTVAIGSCAAFGGITAAENNPGDACGLQYEGGEVGGLLGGAWRSPAGYPVINIAGCPTHPDWVTDLLAQLALGEFATGEAAASVPALLDELNRPKAYTDHLVHHGCARNEYYEYKASAESLGDLGCMMEHKGCLGTQARADCNIRPWNGVGSCLDGGYPCINCTAPDFESPRHRFTETPKIGGIPVGLPTDMPKAWFVALASLSKAATPQRLKDNATASAIVTPPGKAGKPKVERE
ncbi:MAG: NADH-quinone oxidoreductase subunit B family protein [Thiotrichales bacterium]